MGYWITRFGSTDLSLIQARQSTGLGEAALAVMGVPGGGAHDAWGAEQAPVRLPYEIVVEAELVETTSGALKTALYALRALHGARALLYRSPDGGEENSESVLARLVSVSAERESENVLIMPVSMVFQVLEPIWAGAAHTETITLDASPKSQDCDNDGNALQRDVTITVTASGSSITALLIENLETGHISKIGYSGSIAAGKALVIDCGARTVRNNGTDDYAHFSLGAAHTIADWLRLMPGANTIRVTRTGGDNASACVLTYNDAWA